VSSLEIYHAAIKTLAEAGTGHGRLEAPDGQALIDNPLCGDRVEIEVAISGARIARLAHRVRGCLLCRAAAAAIGARAVGANAEEIGRVATQLAAMLEADEAPGAGWEGGWAELGAFVPVRGHRSRYGCVLLPFKSLLAALRAGGS